MGIQTATSKNEGIRIGSDIMLPQKIDHLCLHGIITQIIDLVSFIVCYPKDQSLRLHGIKANSKPLYSVKS